MDKGSYMKQWRKNNADKIKAYRKIYINKNKDKIKIYNREYSKSHPRFFTEEEKIERNKYNMEWRHRKGINIKYNDGKYYIRSRLHKKIECALQRYSGDLDIKILQRVYEDNVKKYGTLTCCICDKPIEFGQDSLDHNIPASRGGTNDYDNLIILHLNCNFKKRFRTVEEYKEWILRREYEKTKI